MTDKTISGEDHCALCGKELRLDETQFAYHSVGLTFCKACGVTQKSKDLVSAYKAAKE